METCKNGILCYNDTKEEEIMERIAIISDVNAGLDYLKRDPQIPVLRSL
jgi:hypothetical protein